MGSMNRSRSVFTLWGMEVFKNPGDVALRNMINGYGGDGLTDGLEDLSDLFQPQ